MSEQSKPIVGKCFKCTKDVTSEEHCYGCKAFVCDTCDVANQGGDMLAGPHKREEHLKPLDSEDDL